MDAIAEFLPEGTSLEETAAGSPPEQPRPAPAVSATAAESPKFKDATRVLVSVLSPLEKRTLHLAGGAHAARINSDHLTVLALAAMVGAGLSYWLASVTPVGLVLAAVFLAINWFGDSLDGTLARVRQHQRPRYGYYVDHVVDAFGALFLFGGLALSGYMSPAIAVRPAHRLLHGVDRGLPGDAQPGHVQDHALLARPDRAAHPARDRQLRAARPPQRRRSSARRTGSSTSAARSASPGCSSPC